VIANCDIRLAVPNDALAIAGMSRDFVERGLGWKWTPARVLGCIRDRATNVAVSHERGDLAGFGIMKYHDDEAHLCLLAVDPFCRRKGVGAAILSWLETTALTAGIGTIFLEARATNVQARDFYKKLGYREMALVPGYYWGREDAVQIAKDLWQ
jgi:ribosomal-protein-alanine N-acetyltransferase